MPSGRKSTPDEERELLWAEFERSMKRPVMERIARGCLWTFKPVLDEGPGVRVWDTMEDYRRWCNENLPEWLGYKTVTDEEWEEYLRRADE